MSTYDLNAKHLESGSPAAEGMIPLCVPEIRGNEWRYIKECLDTNWVSSAGPFVDRFERKLAGYVGTKHAVATCNGTAALHIALLVAGVEPGDEVLVPTLTFIASANVIRYVGAWPVFMDAEADYWQMNPEKVIDFVERKCRYKNGELINKTTGRRVKAILPAHILGHPVDIDPIIKIAQKFDLVVIEDATESLGARYKESMVGYLGDIACFSFNGNKIITTGGGGMIVTDNQKWAERARYLTTQAKDNSVEFIHREIGYNFRLSSIQAAMGVAQMERIDEYIAAKRSIAQRYCEGLRDIAGICLPVQAGWAQSIFWLYTVLIDEQKFGMTSRDVLRTLASFNIQTRPLWHPLHKLRPFKGCFAYEIEVADKLYRNGLSLPCSVGLSVEDQFKVIEAFKKSKSVYETE